MRNKVQKWGNSLALRNPLAMASESKLLEAVELTRTEEGLFVKPVRKHPSLRDLVDRIAPHNVHEKVDLGSANGQETW